VVRKPRSPDDAFVAGVRISNPDRTVYPDDAVTKLQVAEYYHAIADWVLPHLVDRPLSLVRCPLGLAGESFYQRHLGEGFPDALRPIDIGESEEGPGIVIRDLEGLLSLVQMGVLEIHPWGCRADSLEKPDRLIIDLDPGQGIEWEHVVASARVVRDGLGELGLESFVKTSGGKGLHVVAPIVRRSSWEEIKSFAGAFVQGLVNMAPMNFVATMSKTMRANRIYLDYLRNSRSATAVGAYSTRAQNGATVSTPLRWEELLPESPPRGFNVRSVPNRLAGIDRDPWEGFFELRQSITAKMRRAVGL
jgi:bifunctional non-homologous end joining protein LigD